jgi:biopolymer transport protein ExbB
MNTLLLLAFQILFPIYHSANVTGPFSRSLTLDHTQAGTVNSTNFPLLFLGNASLATVANGGHVTSSSGFDIIFCTTPTSHSACLASLLPFERVAWSATTGLGEFWIQVPTLSVSANTVIYVYYGDSAITTDQQNVTGTWDSNFAAVYHFGAGVSVTLTDSTSNANNCTNNSTTAVAGALTAGAASFSGSSQYISCGTPSSLNITSAYTIEAITNRPSNPSIGTFPRIVSKLGTTTQGWEALLHDPTGFNNLAFYQQTIAGSQGDPAMPGSSANSAINTNYILAWEFSSGGSSNALTYWNGVPALDSPTTWATTPTSSSAIAMLIGAYASGPSNYWVGTIDEVRISNIARPTSYFVANYANYKSGSTFITVGPQVP